MRFRALLGATALFAGVLASSVWLVPPAAAAQLVVNTSTDSVDGSCDVAPGGCTLRDAFAVASTNGVPDEIILEAGTEYVLSDCGEGDLDHAEAQDLTITGNGATIRQQCAGERVIEQAGAGALLTLDSVTLTGGTPAGGDDGGAVYALGPVTVTTSTISGNSAGSGAGLYVINGNVTVTSSTISGNIAEDVGGGILAAGAGVHITLTNSTVTGNQADEGGGVSTSSTAGEVSVFLRYATVVGNTALAGANIEGEGLDSFASVVALGSGSTDCFVSGPMASTGWSFSGDASCGFGTGPGDQPAAGDPLVGVLGSNGGPTLTRVPDAGSPLLDRIPGANCRDDGAAAVTTDQRGVTRPQNDMCDVGAVEVEVEEPDFDGGPVLDFVG